MSDDQSTVDESVEDQPTDEIKETPQVDELKNLKAETGRKMENLSNQLAEITRNLQSLTAKQTPQAPQPKIKDLIYEDADAAAEIITQRAVDRATDLIGAKMQRENSMQLKMQELSGQYPEFRDGNSEAFQKAQAIHNSLPTYLQNTAEGAELAMTRAVSQLGLTMQNKRRTVDDGSFVPGPNTNPSRNRQSAEPKLTNEQMEFAEILAGVTGRDFNDKDLQAGLKKAAKRKSWKSYEG